MIENDVERIEKKLGVRKYWKGYVEYIIVLFGILFFVVYFTQQFIIIFTIVLVFISNGTLNFIHFFYVGHTILLFIVMLSCFIYYFSKFELKD